MRPVILSLMLCFAHPVLLWCQSWIQPEATWHHSYGDANSGVFGYVITTVQGDTLLNDTLALRLDGVLHGYSVQTQQFFTQQISTITTSGTEDLALAWTGSAFDTLFHFAAVPGDRWQPPGALPGDPELTVLDTGHTAVDGEWLRYLVMDLGPLSNQPSPDTLFQRLGCLNGYLDVWNSFLVDGGFGRLRCYSDIDMSYSADDTPCDLILKADNAPPSAQRISVYPNPGQQFVWFENLSPNDRPRLRVIDMRGVPVLEKTLTDVGGGIDLSDLASGCYSLQLIANDGQYNLVRWVKQ